MFIAIPQHLVSCSSASQDLTLLDTVGTGTFGRVRLVVHKPANAIYALKILKKSEVRIKLRRAYVSLPQMLQFNYFTHVFI